MGLLSEGSSVKESPEDKQTSVPCVKGNAKISRRVALALYTGVGFIHQKVRNSSDYKMQVVFLLFPFLIQSHFL